MFFLFVQLIGVVALAFHVLSFHGRTRVRIIATQIVAMGLWVLHFSLLQAWTGALLVSTGVVVAVFLLNKDRWKFVGTWIFKISVFVTQAVAAALVWEGVFSALVLLGVWTATISRWQTSQQRIRVLAAVASAFWIAYDFSVSSYSGLATEVLIIASTVVALWRGKSDPKR